MSNILKNYEPKTRLPSNPSFDFENDQVETPKLGVSTHIFAKNFTPQNDSKYKHPPQTPSGQSIALPKNKTITNHETNSVPNQKVETRHCLVSTSFNQVETPNLGVSTHVFAKTINQIKTPVTTQNNSKYKQNPQTPSGQSIELPKNKTTTHGVHISQAYSDKTQEKKLICQAN